MTQPTAAARALPQSGRLVHLPRDPGVLWAAGAATVGAWSAASLGEGVMEHEDLSSYDASVTETVVNHRTPVVTVVAHAVTFVGSEVSIGLLSAIVLAWLVLRRRARLSAAVFSGSMLLAGVATLGVKHWFSRTRPPAAVMLGPVDTGYSFPSGHTLYSTVFFGLVAGLLLMRATHARQRLGVVLGWVAVSAAVGLSRLYLGYHWMTDVLAGWSLAVVILGVGAVAALMLRPRPAP